MVIGGGMFFTALFLILAALCKAAAINGFLVNLAASATTVSFTTAIVDWLIEKERFAKTESSLRIAAQKLEYEALDAKLRLAMLFGWEMDYGRGGDSTGGILETLNQRADLFLKKSSFKSRTKKDEEIFLSVMPPIQSDIEEIVTYYGYCMPVQLIEKALTLRDQIRALLDAWKFYAKKGWEDEFSKACRDLYGEIINLDNELGVYVHLKK